MYWMDYIALRPQLLYIEYRDLGGKAPPESRYIWQSTIRISTTTKCTLTHSNIIELSACCRYESYIKLLVDLLLIALLFGGK